MKRLKLRRLSTRPNQYGSWAYLIVDADDEKVVAFLDGKSGIYDGRDGGKILYSQARVGSHDKDVTVDIRETESDGRTFINLVDSSSDKLAGEMYEVVQKVNLAGSFFGGRKTLNKAQESFLAAVGGNAAASLFGAPKIAAPIAIEAEPVKKEPVNQNQNKEEEPQ
jgi:hypothetical protein